jgi:hypothetical protein
VANNVFVCSKHLAKINTPTGLREKDGAYGKRHHSRGLTGFHEPGRSPSKKATVIEGALLVEWLMAQERWAEAEKVIDSLS